MYRTAPELRPVFPVRLIGLKFQRAVTNGVRAYMNSRLIWLFLFALWSLPGCNGKQQQQEERKIIPVADRPALLATIPVDAALPVQSTTGPAYHAPSTPTLEITFSENGGGVVYSAAKGEFTQVIHNGVPGKAYKTVGRIALSPDGKRVAYGALVDKDWHMVVDGTEGAAYNTVRSPIFSEDGKHLLYQAMKGNKWHLVIDSIPNAGTQKRYMYPLFSGNASRLAYVDDVGDTGRGRLVVSDAGFSQQTIVESAGAGILTVNTDRTRVAATLLQNGKQRVIDFSFDKPGDSKKGELYDNIQNLSFGPDGVSLTYFAERNGKRFVVFDNREEPLPEGGSLVEGPAVRPDLKGLGSIISVGSQSFLWYAFGDNGVKGKNYDEMAGQTYSRHDSRYAFAARRGDKWFVVTNGTEGMSFDKVVSPMFSPDGKYLVYRARKDGKRFVVIADSTGRILRQHPTYEQVFDVKFTMNGKSVAYGVKDGQQLLWKVEPL